MRRLSRGLHYAISRFAYLVAVLLVTGCGSLTHLGYEPLVRDLDGNSELRISTYPAWFGTDKISIPFIYVKSQTHNEVYFQVFICDKKQNCGPNPHIESILIKSFSYSLDGQPRRQLLSNYSDNFWMQGNPRYEKQELSPIPYRRGSSISVEINFTLNGKDYAIEGEMPAFEKMTLYPLILETLS